MQLTFWGAAGMVTGSSYLIETGGRKLLVDCGMFQGSKATEALNRRPFPYDVSEVEAVLLTHAHIDHSGLLPRLCKAGFRGRIYATNATADLCRIMLPDSAHIQEFEAEFANRKGRRAGRAPVEPLYTVDDAYVCLKQFAPTPYESAIAVMPNVTALFRDAGHILGSSIIELTVAENGSPQKLVFSGDLGQPGQPLIKDPAYVGEADYVVMESTYGNRRHEQADKGEMLAGIINDTVKRGGNVVIPAFAVGRTQTILYYLHKLLKANAIPDIPVFIDSPLAISATDIFDDHPQDFDVEAYDLLCNQHDNPLRLPRLKFTRTAEESKTINMLKEPAVIISASGMADAGRILHHLKHNLWRPESSVVLVGYQAEGSLGRRLVDGVRRVKIMGEEINVRAKVFNLDGFSAHGDQEVLLDWLAHFSALPAGVFVVHGEPEQSAALAEMIKDKLKVAAYVPHYGDTVTISGREFGIEAGRMTLLEPAAAELQLALEQLDGEYMELRKRLEGMAGAGQTRLAELVRGTGKVRRSMRTLIEKVNGKSDA